MTTSLRIHRHVLRSRTTDPFCVAAPDAVGSDLAEALRAAVPADRGGVWLIRRLDVRAAVAGGTGMRATAAALAAALVHELDRTLDAGPTEVDVRWYPDRAAFLTQWLVDLRTGDSSGRWEYRDFAAGSASAAIRLRAAAEPDCFLAALRRLTGADLDEVIGLLAPADAAAVVHSLSCGPDSARASELAATAALLWAAGRLVSDPRRATLLLLVTHGISPGSGDAALARDISLVLLDVRSCGWGDRDSLLAALHDGDWATATRLGGSAAVTALASWPAAARGHALQAIREAISAAKPPLAEHGYTRFGGQFLLLPLLAELPFAQATSSWPALDGTGPDVVLAALAMAGVLGTDLVLADPFFRLATGLPQRSLADLVQWCEDVGVVRFARLGDALDDVVQRRADAVRADLADPHLLVAGLPDEAAAAVRIVSSVLVRELAYRLPGMATASVAHLRSNVLAFGAHVTIDEERIAVELERPPLNLLLSLTGMNRRSYTLPATGNRPWLITTQR